MPKTCLALFVLLAVATAPAQAQVKREFTHEGWNGFVMVKDGKFAQCYMSLPAMNNYDLILALNPDGEMRLALRSQKIDTGWGALLQQKYGVRIQLDDGPVVTRPFAAKSKSTLSTSLKGSDLEAKLVNASQLRINDGRLRVFRLNGIKEAMGKLRACTAKHRTA